MKAGRRTPNPDAKKLAGTFRADRHATIVELVQPVKSVPVQPGYLSPEAQAIWAEEIARVTGCGAVDADSSLFATYCEIEAACRVAFMRGELPKAAYLTELRRLRELLCIAGVRSRLAKSSPEPDAKPNPFSLRK